MNRTLFLAAIYLAAPFAAVARTDDEERSNVRIQVDYLTPQRHSLLSGTRDIDVIALNVSHDWKLPVGFKVGLTAGALIASGERHDFGQPVINSDATGALFGGGLRFAPVTIGPVTPFVDGSIQFLYTFGRPFPAGGTSVNGFVRWGGGASVKVSKRLSVEAGWHGAHISNGGKSGVYNPGWDGHGAFVGIRLHTNRK